MEESQASPLKRDALWHAASAGQGVHLLRSFCLFGISWSVHHLLKEGTRWRVAGHLGPFERGMAGRCTNSTRTWWECYQECQLGVSRHDRQLGYMDEFDLEDVPDWLPGESEGRYAHRLLETPTTHTMAVLSQHSREGCLNSAPVWPVFDDKHKLAGLTIYHWMDGRTRHARLSALAVSHLLSTCTVHLDSAKPRPSGRGQKALYNKD